MNRSEQVRARVEADDRAPQGHWNTRHERGRSHARQRPHLDRITYCLPAGGTEQYFRAADHAMIDPDLAVSGISSCGVQEAAVEQIAPFSCGQAMK